MKMQAAQLSDRHMGRDVTIGNVTGTLEAVQGGPGDVVVARLVIGGHRAWFELFEDTFVDVGPRPKK